MRVMGTAGGSGPTLATGERGVILDGRPVLVTPALTILDGPNLGACVRLDDAHRAIILGRAPEASFVIPHATVSRAHARVFVMQHEGAERVKIVDLDSRNGTFVNGEQIEECWLDAGDKLHVGDVLLRFDLMDPVEASFQDEVATRVRDADIDPLTGLYRRTVLPREGAASLRSCQDRGDAFAVLMIDLDHFKKVNDTWGHQAGDEALRVAARAVMAAIRCGDLAVRYGGEEVAILLGRAGVPEARVIAERVASALRALPVAGLPSDRRLTCSQGLACARFGEGLDDVIRRADLALMRAKRGGRDRIEVDASPV